QYKASETVKRDAMDRLIEWLPETIPNDDKVTVVHGDYRLDNMVLHATEPRVAAVLDWELATLGNPLADLVHVLGNWIHGALAAIPDLKAHGIPTIEEFAGEYCKLTGRKDLPNLDW